MKRYSRLRPMSIREIRNEFISFLRERGHGLVDPYPVLAKWRNDLYLTIASIVVFQPEATEGLVEPPYNPLVIIQPSIRLTDIDNVGLTFGRHLSSFEMGGMHAFNKPDKFIYWSEGIIDNTIEFFNKRVGIDLDDLVFKEGWWEGGGNAGPAPEVLVDGIEVATLVHMGYKVIDGKYEVNPVLVVDCGYGIERIAWLSQQTPTGFHAIYGDLLKRYLDILGVDEPPRDVLYKVVYSLSDKEDNRVEDLLQELEKMGLGEYAKSVVNSVYLYSILDHVRTIALMLSDGIIPSNTGEGYLARLVIRRLLRNMIKLGVDYHRLNETLAELVDKQIEYWRGDYIYGKFMDHREHILELLDIETSKFINAVLKGAEIVEKALRKKREITIDDLIEFYDSHGIPPEFIAERAEKYGVKVTIPSDFYSIVASRHQTPRQLVKQKEHEFPAEIAKWAIDFPETRRVFHENPYLIRISARVLGVNDRYVILDQTIAYPWAGGQDHDEGIITNGLESYRITYVGKVGDVIVHELDRKPNIKPGDIVHVEIDWPRRYQLMRHHTATHVILASARKILGNHVWQAGAEKTLEKARLDITHHKPLTPEVVKEIERLANKIINDRLSLRFEYMDRFTAENKYGIKIHQGGAIHSQSLRIVEIPGWDAQACFGTHLHNTSEIGGVKIINYERIQDGVVRLEFIAGPRLVDEINRLEDEKKHALSMINAREQDLVSAVKRLQNEIVEHSNLIAKYREYIESLLTRKALDEKLNICGVDVVVIELPARDSKLIEKLHEELVFRNKLLVALMYEDTIELSISPDKAKELNIDLRSIVTRLSSIYNARGGGKQDHVTIKTPSKIPREALIETLSEVICLRDNTR